MEVPPNHPLIDGFSMKETILNYLFWGTSISGNPHMWSAGSSQHGYVKHASFFAGRLACCGVTHEDTEVLRKKTEKLIDRLWK